VLDALRKQKADFTYYPIDISANIISQLGRDLPVLLPGIKLKGLNGEYFRMLDKMKDISTRKKVALFLGSTIGNILPENTIEFLKSLRSHLATGDLVLTGFDLKKDPAVILAAYNDKGGITRRFNLNLLQRINDTLNANFDVTRFAHRPEYNEQTGACKSYLVSSCHQTVHIGKVGCINFEDGEHIFMEVSQKYTEEQIDEFAAASGFRPLQNFYDSKHWFVDALWQCV
jgi:L-histidine N-alpha-methyltransferase